VYDNFDEIRQEIENRTDQLAGDNKGICDDPINLKIFSHKVVNLTLVDLPGITKVAVGDQPEDIEDQVKKLVFKFIENPNSIILAVSAANVDLATSEALKFAKQVDPDGTRTLAVLTKLDLMDQGTNAVEVLSGRVIPVKLGIIGVVNRSQQSINDKKNIEEQLKIEASLLEAKYPKLADQNGTPYLEKTLSRLLVRHIYACLPDLKERVNLKTLEYQKKINELGKAVENKDETMIQILTSFAHAYSATLEGISAYDGCGTTNLYEIIHENFSDTIDSIHPCVKLSLDKDLATLTNGTGPRPTLFSIPSFDGPFERIVKEKVNMLRLPSYRCIKLVHEEMQRVIQNCGTHVEHEMRRFPRLREKIVAVTNSLIYERMKDVTDEVKKIIDIETAYVNKKHPDFDKVAVLALAKNPHLDIGDIARSNKSGNPPSLPALGQELTMEEKQTILKGLITSYFYIVRKTVKDSVPKTIMHFLVNYVKENIQSHLISQVYKTAVCDEIMKESNNIAFARKDANDMMKVSRN
jgi:dynamin 1-like protein